MAFQHRAFRNPAARAHPARRHPLSAPSPPFPLFPKTSHFSNRVLFRHAFLLATNNWQLATTSPKQSQSKPPSCRATACHLSTCSSPMFSRLTKQSQRVEQLRQVTTVRISVPRMRGAMRKGQGVWGITPPSACYGSPASALRAIWRMYCPGRAMAVLRNGAWSRLPCGPDGLLLSPYQSQRCRRREPVSQLQCGQGVSGDVADVLLGLVGAGLLEVGVDLGGGGFVAGGG